MKVWTVPISLATTKGILYLVSFPLGTEMFHFPRCPSATYVFSGRIIALHAKGFPHSEISGSKVACHLPGAYRRLLRLSSALHCQVIHRMPLCASTIRMSERFGSLIVSTTTNYVMHCLQVLFLCLARITFESLYVPISGCAKGISASSA